MDSEDSESIHEGSKYGPYEFSRDGSLRPWPTLMFTSLLVRASLLKISSILRHLSFYR